MKKHLIWYKVAALFLLLTFCNSAVFSQGKTVTVHLKNASLKQLFESIEKQTTYRFSCRNVAFDDFQDITVEKTGVLVNEVLDAAFSGRTLKYEIVSPALIVVFNNPQTKVATGEKLIKGVICDSNGDPLIGATVKLKNNPLGVVTDIDGNFEIKASEGETLEVSYIGFLSQNIKLGKQSKLNIRLSENTQALNEVVVTGFQTLSRERASGSFETINKNVLEKLPSADVTTLLRGQMSGVDTDKSGRISIRGMSYLPEVFGSDDSYRAPLVVVDGFPIEGGIESVNPNNIENITVLKDAAAASIWGARSANGVIVITTKTGKGDGSDGLSINFNSYVRMSSKIDLNYANPIADGKSQLALEHYFADELYKYNSSGIYNPTLLSSANSGVQRTLGSYLYAMQNIGYLSKEDVARRVSQLEGINYQDDVNKYLLRNPVYQQHNFQVRGNTKRNKYNFSMLYDKNMSDFIGTDNDRIITEFKDVFKFNNYITFNVGAYMSVGNNKNDGATLNEIKTLASYDRLVNPDGTYNNHSANVNYGMRSYLNTLPLAYSWDKNLLQDVNTRDLRSENLIMRFQGGVDVKISKDLTFSTKYQYEKNRTENSEYYAPDNYFTRSKINAFSPIDKNQTTVGPSYFPKGGIRKNLKRNNVDAYNFRSQLDYNKTIRDLHEISLMGGVELIQNLSTLEKLPWQFGIDPNSNSVAILPNTNTVVPHFTGQNQYIDIDNLAPMYDYSKRRYFSAFFNGSYTYNRKYTLTASVRTDASNIISSDPKYRYVPLWSTGFNWNLKEEKFVQKLNIFDQLNLRSSYGFNAQAATGTSNITTISNEVGSQFNEYNTVGNVQSHGNPNLRWEKTEVVNVGLDFSIKHAALFGKLDFYNKKGVDLFYNYVLPGTLGMGESMKMNYASVLNRGFELELGTNLAIHKGISLTSNFNYSYNFNKILRLDDQNQLVANTVGTSAYIQGGKVGDYYAFDYAGFYNNIPYVRAQDGTPYPMTASLPATSNAKVGILRNMGTTIAPHIIGWTNTLRINDFSITAIITGKFGHVFARNSMFASNSLNNQYNFNKDLPANVNNRWSEDYPALINSTTISQLQKRLSYLGASSPIPNSSLSYLSSDVDNASFIRFDNLIFDYNFNKLGQKRGFLNYLKGLTVYGEVRNLGNLWVANKWGMDPEYIEGTVKPQTSFALGFKLTI